LGNYQKHGSSLACLERKRGRKSKKGAKHFIFHIASFYSIINSSFIGESESEVETGETLRRLFVVVKNSRRKLSAQSDFSLRPQFLTISSFLAGIALVCVLGRLRVGVQLVDNLCLVKVAFDAFAHIPVSPSRNGSCSSSLASDNPTLASVPFVDLCTVPTLADKTSRSFRHTQTPSLNANLRRASSRKILHLFLLVSPDTAELSLPTLLWRRTGDPDVTPTSYKLRL